MGERKIYYCPVCGEDTCRPTPDELKQRIRRAGGCGIMIDSGGGVVQFEFGNVRIGDHCEACDDRTIERFLEAHGK